MKSVHRIGKQRGYRVSAPLTPGARPVVAGAAATLADARRLARGFSHRRDLTYQDVRIERPSGSLVEYAGPPR